MQSLIKKLNTLGIGLEIVSMEKLGCYVPAWKKIFVNEDLEENEMKRVILHEMKHVLDHSDYLELYKMPIYHSKMENEADIYMIESVIEENEGKYNFGQLIEEFRLPMGYETRYAK